MKILIVDDASFTRLSMRKMVEQLNATALEADSAEQAWKIVNEQRPALVISDQNLPGKSGIEFYMQIRETRKIPFCLMTHRPDSELLNKAIASGISHVFSKPINPADLKKVIAQYFPGESGAESKSIDVTLNPAALTVATDAAKRAKVTVTEYLSTMLNQMLQPAEPVEATADKPVVAKV